MTLCLDEPLCLEPEMAKKTDQINVKLTASKKTRALAIANVLEVSLSEYVESLITADLKAKERAFRLMAPVFGGESNKGNSGNGGS